MLNAEDPDSPTSDLVYTVLNQGGKSEEKGFVERIGKPGLKVDSFTQKEIDNNAIVFVHRGKENSNSRLALQVASSPPPLPPSFLINEKSQFLRKVKNCHFSGLRWD